MMMEEFVAKEPLILFEIGGALSEGRVLPEAVQGWWKNIVPSNAEQRPLVLGKSSGKIVCAFRQIPGSWHQRNDGRGGSIRYERTTFGTTMWVKPYRADTAIHAHFSMSPPLKRVADRANRSQTRVADHRFVGVQRLNGLGRNLCCPRRSSRRRWRDGRLGCGLNRASSSRFGGSRYAQIRPS